jgi:hypothetical protein
LKLGVGLYQIVQPISVKDGGSITGSGWETVIAESTSQLIVIMGSEAYGGAYGTNSGISLTNFKIIGANANFNSAPQTVQLGNCVGCTVDHLWLDRTHTIGIQLGGTALNGNWARDSKITNCLLTHIASQAIAVVNGENIEISGNRILRPGQVGGPGNSSIDLECNAETDRLINIRVAGNIVDHTDSEMGITGNGIIANSTLTANVGGIVIEGNTVIGGGHLSNGIMVAGTHMTGTRVVANKVTRTGQTGLWVTGANLTVEDNVLENVGGGGIAGFRIDGVRDSSIQRNSVVCNSGPCDPRIEMLGENQNNVIANNSGWQ